MEGNISLMPTLKLTIIALVIFTVLPFSSLISPSGAQSQSLRTNLQSVSSTNAQADVSTFALADVPAGADTSSIGGARRKTPTPTPPPPTATSPATQTPPPTSTAISTPTASPTPGGHLYGLVGQGGLGEQIDTSLLQQQYNAGARLRLLQLGWDVLQPTGPTSWDSGVVSAFQQRIDAFVLNNS